jgi:VWFA-related protein
VSALLAGLVLAGAAQATPVFRADVELVRVEVLVTRGGEPVRGLTARDFELRDNGRVQGLEPVLEEVTPVDALFVLDTSASMIGAKLRAVQEAASAFLDGLHDGERASLVTIQHEVRLLEPLTADLGRVRRALSRIEAQGSTALVDGVYAALRATDPGPRRTAVVVFSDGVDNRSWLSAAEAVEAARRTGAIVYGVAVRERSDRTQPFLRDVTRATGGRLFEAAKADELRARFLDVLADIRNRYVLRYTPGSGDVPGWHTLEVKLKRDRGDVLARPGYWRTPSAR